MPTPEDELQAFIAVVRRRWMACRLLRAIGVAALAGAVPLATAVLVARLVPLHGEALVITALVGIAASIGAMVFQSVRNRVAPDDFRVACFVEEWAAASVEVGPLNDALVSAVAVALRAGEPGPGPGRFGSLVVSGALARLQGVRPAAVVPAAVLRRGMSQAIGGIAALGLALFFAVAPFRAAADAALLAWFPRAIDIEVLPGDVRLAAGRPLTIRATVRVGGRLATDLTPSLIVSTAEERRTVAMGSGQQGFEFLFDSIDRSIRYQVTAGSRRSREFSVAALFPPAVKRIDAHYEFPAFTGLAPRDHEGAGDLFAPAGTRVRLRVHSDKPIVSGALAFTTSTETLSLRHATETVLEADLVITANAAYRLQLADGDGLRGGGDTEYFIRMMDDRPPAVRIIRPAGEQQITPLEEVTIEAEADDDHGIAALDLVYAVAGRPERTVPFSRLSGSSVARVGAQLLQAEDLQLQPGDVITCYARARDVPRGQRPRETKSDIVFLEVRPFTEEFMMAQSQAMAPSGDPQLAALITAQKDIISATWNVERRAGVARSTADVKAIAEAQEELRVRAGQMIGAAPRRTTLQLPQQIGPFVQRRPRPAAGEAVAAAVEAMGLAARELQSDKTTTAMPHEMKALQDLLRAQSEVQRRQVGQQAAGAAGGGLGRQGQDMSALFDKELQRQQRTNYEPRARADESRSSQPEERALDRIRELARRQEELAREARALTPSLADEERKRQLERLAREQEKLQAEADGMTRQLQTGGAGGRGSTPGAATDLRSTVEQMRQAANDLRHDNPDAAAARADQAAAQLQRLEQQMRADASSGRGRRGAGAGVESQERVEAEGLSRQLEETRAIRERLDRLGAQIRSAEAQGRGGRAGSDGRGQGSERGRAGQRQSSGEGEGEGALAQLRGEYGRELVRAQERLARLGQGRPRGSLGGATPEDQVFSQSSPGTEAFKQDDSSWESLRKDINLALERHDAAVSARLARSLNGDRLTAGGSERAPDAYARRIARYYAALARAQK